MKVLSDVMELLFRQDIGSTMHDVTEVMLTVLRTVIQASISLDRNHPNVVSLLALKAESSIKMASSCEKLFFSTLNWRKSYIFTTNIPRIYPKPCKRDDFILYPPVQLCPID